MHGCVQILFPFVIHFVESALMTSHSLETSVVYLKVKSGFGEESCRGEHLIPAFTVAMMETRNVFRLMHAGFLLVARYSTW